MNLRELLDHLSAQYRMLLDAWLAYYRSDATVSRVIVESPFWIRPGEPFLSNELRVPTRKDLGVVSTDGRVTLVSIDTNERLAFQPFGLVSGALAIQFHPTTWDGMRLIIAAESPDWGPLVSWYLRWYGDLRRPQDRWGEEVHFMSDPQIRGAHQYELELDLGSAPGRACAELLDAVAATGASSVRIG